jgi:hypothetical protein
VRLTNRTKGTAVDLQPLLTAAEREIVLAGGRLSYERQR